MKLLAVLFFACIVLSSCDARRLKRQIVEQRYPAQFGNQFFPQQGGGFFQFPNNNQFNQFPNNNQFNQFPNNNQFNQFPNNNQFNQFPNNNNQNFNQNPNNNQQQINNQRPNQNNQQINTQRPTQQQASTQATPTQPPTTLSPAVEACRDRCPQSTTAEYNPVCGSDNQNYHNLARLECARDCGVNTSFSRRGTCGQAGRS